MKNRHASSDTVLCAGLCLLAVALLYGPFAAAAFSARAAACCTPGYCPLAENHRSKAPAAPSSPKNCGHDMAGMASCSMSCCQSPDRPAVTPFAFLLPSPISPIVPVGATESATALKTVEIPQSIEPASPPPRFVAAAL